QQQRGEIMKRFIRFVNCVFKEFLTLFNAVASWLNRFPGMSCLAFPPQASLPAITCRPDQKARYMHVVRGFAAWRT
ncbi:MAG TPA: hypothetical protein DHV59_09625, partial [Oxalobacteraceae bacterium]|nr:hypothetical protein [Oxalobacteraceae bacterium]